jgi:mono/diheme cytochrome c family protein
MLITVIAWYVWASPVLAQVAPNAPRDSGASEQVGPPSAKDGAVLFSKSGCPFCHGPQGFGTDKAPNLREVRKRKTDEEIVRQIHDGGKMMPPFADALTESDIHSLVLFLRAEDGWLLLPPPENSK